MEWKATYYDNYSRLMICFKLAVSNGCPSGGGFGAATWCAGQHSQGVSRSRPSNQPRYCAKIDEFRSMLFIVHWRLMVLSRNQIVIRKLDIRVVIAMSSWDSWGRWQDCRAYLVRRSPFIDKPLPNSYASAPFWTREIGKASGMPNINQCSQNAHLTTAWKGRRQSCLSDRVISLSFSPQHWLRTTLITAQMLST